MGLPLSGLEKKRMADKKNRVRNIHEGLLVRMATMKSRLSNNTHAALFLLFSIVA